MSARRKRGGTLRVASVVATLAPAFACAQIATDGTLGAATALAGPNFAIPASLGRQAGANLFHSFATFGVPTGGSATFSGPAGVGNVISRVTGGSASSIDGTLRSTIAGANLFLINPSGILFGPNASLDLTGSFHASTASYLKFADGVRFDAMATVPAQLSIAAPEAFGFLEPKGEIVLAGTALDMAAGRGLSFTGGSIRVDGASLRTRAADLRLAAVAAGELPLGTAAAALADTVFGRVEIARAQVRTQSSGALAPGRLVIRGGEIAIADSLVRSTNAAPADAPPVELIATGDLQYSGGQLLANTQGLGRGADIVARGANVTVDRAALVQSWTTARGSAGDIDMAARGALAVVAAPEDPDYTAIYAVSFAPGPGGAIRLSGDRVAVDSAVVMSQTSGDGAGGPVSLSAREIDLKAGALVATYATDGSTGTGGELKLAATERVLLEGKDWTDYFTRAATWNAGTGRAGDLVVEAPSVFVRESANLRSEVFASGRGGDIVVRASRRLEVDGTRGEAGIVSPTWYGSAGDGGNITLEAPDILFDGPALIWAPTGGAGNTGSIRIRTHDIEIRSGASIFTDVAPWSTGQGGNVSLEGTGTLTMATVAKAPFSHWVLNPEIASIGAFTAGPGRSGDVTVTIPDIRGGLESNIVAFSKGAGDAGNLAINAQRVRLTGRSKITVWADVWSDPNSRSRAGSIVLNIGESLELSGAGDPGLLEERFGQAWMRRGGIELSSLSDGDAGSVVINAPRIVLDDAAISATTWRSGRGGRIEIHTDDLALRNGGQIEARAFPGSTGDAGAVLLDARNAIDISGLSAVDGRFSGIVAETWGGGRGGDVALRTGTLRIDRGIVRSSTGGDGRAGTIDIAAREVVLENGGAIDAGTAPGSTGQGGRVGINAERSILVKGVDRAPSVAVARLVRGDPAWDAAFGPGRGQGPAPSAVSTNTAGSGAGGDIVMHAASIRIEDGARVAASSSGSGAAGSIEMTAEDAVRIAGGAAISATTAGDGQGGNVALRARGAFNAGGAGTTISTSTAGRGAGGRVSIAADTITLDDGTTVAAGSTGPGAGGAITLEANRIAIADGATVAATSTGTGAAGRIDVRAADALHLFGGAITTDAQASDGGNIDVRAGRIIHLRDGEISTSVAGGAGAGGNIFIDPTFVIIEDGSRIFANAFGGPGGNITLIADYLFSSIDSLVQASSALGLPGTVTIASPQNNVNSTLAKLPGAVLDASALLREGCATRYSGRGGASSLVDVGRGGLAASPERLASSRYFGGESLRAIAAPGPSAAPATLAAARARMGGCAG